MPNAITISEFTFNNGSTYAFKDAVARAAIDNLNSFEYTVCTSASNTPKDITWNDITGTLNPSEDTKYRIYLVPSTNGTDDIYDEYLTIQNGNEYLWEKIGNTDVNLGNYALKDETVSDVQVNGTSVVTNGVANMPVASNSNFGAVKVNANYGIYANDGVLNIVEADQNIVKSGNNDYRPITPTLQHRATFYGLAKAAGSDEKDSSLPVGQYTDAAKSAIRTMIGAASIEDIPDAPVQDVQVNGISVLDQNGTANVPVAGSSRLGVIKAAPTDGLYIDESTGAMVINLAGGSDCKSGQSMRKPIVPFNQHQAIFYGLAKAAGDTTQSQSDNAVGTYTPEAKAAIQTMLGIETGTEVVRLI